MVGFELGRSWEHGKLGFVGGGWVCGFRWGGEGVGIFADGVANWRAGGLVLRGWNEARRGNGDCWGGFVGWLSEIRREKRRLQTVLEEWFS